MATKRALVIGISKYNPPTSKLLAAVPEARNWVNLLQGPPYNFAKNDIKLLEDGQATLGDVRQELINKLDACQPGDLFVFIYCGHGTVVPTIKPVGDEAIVLFHAPDVDPNTAALTDTALSAIVRAHPAIGAIFTIVLEACCSGGFEPTPNQKSATEALRTLGLRSPSLYYMPLEDIFEVESLEEIHRFGGLWDRLAESNSAKPLVIAACKQGKLAEQLSDQHMLFSSRAIPELAKDPVKPDTHMEFIMNINALEKAKPDPQIATLAGDRTRDQNPFFN